MATAPFATPDLKGYPVIPLIQMGAMAHSKPYVAAAPIQKALGFPGELVENWQEKAVAKMGELLGKYRSLKVYMDACVHCGACSDKCHYLSLIHISEPTRLGMISYAVFCLKKKKKKKHII